MKLRLLAILSFIICSHSICSAMEQVELREILSFEQSTEQVEVAATSEVSLSNEHSKHGENSLKWVWSKKGAQISFKGDIGYMAENPDPTTTAISSFVFWAYAKKPIGGDVRFEFLKDGKVCSWFDFNNNFYGWRAGWVAFERDMQGTPIEGMDELRITANSDSGELYLDHLMLSTFLDSRHHTAGFQLPNVNVKTTSHWLILLKSWNNEMEMPLEESMTKEQVQHIAIIMERLKTMLIKGKAPLKYDEAVEAFKSYNIKENSDGTLKGKPVFFSRYAETYNALLKPNPIGKLYTKNNQNLEQLNDLMFNVAVLYNKSKNKEQKEHLSEIYVTLTRYIIDQGFAAGSELGTLHHLGYRMRNFYTAPILMYDVLLEAGLNDEVQQAMEWFSGTGELKLKPTVAGMSIDTFNTSLIGRFASVMMLPDSPYKVAYLKSLTRWLDNGYKTTDGLASCFKTDGTLLHHCKHYPAYAIGGFDGATKGIWLLHNTMFAISEESHQTMKDALLHMRFYSNLRSFPFALSGRHPSGKGRLIPSQFADLALAGSPDGSEAIDTDLVEAYMRLVPESDKRRRDFATKGYSAEEHPQGTKFYPYNSSMSHRRDNWLITAAGHSRYLWAAEHYIGANLYGRYMTHGSLMVLAGDSDKEVTLFGSGFRQEGWDWAHIPGTTAAARPIKELEAVILNVDKFSGYEEMLMSDEKIAGGVTHKGENGLYSMKLHEHDKYNGTLRATKSFFMFDNRVVAIGSDIENKLEDREAHTTLFQTYIGDGLGAMSVNGKSVKEKEYLAKINGKVVLMNNQNNGFVVPNAEVTIKCSEQHSLDEERATPTKNYFSQAYINHGDIVTGGSYEYLMLVDCNQKELDKFARKLPYKVIEASAKAHIVYDNATKITAYALFEGGKVDSELVKSTSIPSLVMTSEKDGELTISVADPDLRLYQGENDEIFDEEGKRVERSIYSRPWKDNASIESEIQIELKGNWCILDGDTQYCTIEDNGENSILSVRSRESVTREIILKKR